MPGSKTFCLPEMWSLLLFHYEMAAVLDGKPCQVRPGHLVLLAPGTTKVYHHQGLGLRHQVVHFNYRGGRHWRQERPSPLMDQRGMATLPLHVDLGSDVAWWTERMAGLIRSWPDRPMRLTIRLWDMLFDLAEFLHPQPKSDLPEAVVAAMGIMQEHVSTELSIAAIAADVGLSHGHLSTLFHQHLGSTPVAWLRRLRMERAAHLLRRSTLAVKDVAAAVGLPNLQHFNKTVRRHFGKSPRELRREP